MNLINEINQFCEKLKVNLSNDYIKGIKRYKDIKNSLHQIMFSKPQLLSSILHDYDHDLNNLNNLNNYKQNDISLSILNMIWLLKNNNASIATIKMNYISKIIDSIQKNVYNKKDFSQTRINHTKINHTKDFSICCMILPDISIIMKYIKIYINNVLSFGNNLDLDLDLEIELEGSLIEGKILKNKIITIVEDYHMSKKTDDELLVICNRYNNVMIEQYCKDFIDDVNIYMANYYKSMNSSKNIEDKIYTLKDARTYSIKYNTQNATKEFYYWIPYNTYNTRDIYKLNNTNKSKNIFGCVNDITINAIKILNNILKMNEENDSYIKYYLECITHFLDQYDEQVIKYEFMNYNLLMECMDNLDMISLNQSNISSDTNLDLDFDFNAKIKPRIRKTMEYLANNIDNENLRVGDTKKTTIIDMRNFDNIPEFMRCDLMIYNIKLLQ